jgi:hypothetical protein
VSVGVEPVEEVHSLRFFSQKAEAEAEAELYITQLFQ